MSTHAWWERRGAAPARTRGAIAAAGCALSVLAIGCAPATRAPVPSAMGEEHPCACPEVTGCAVLGELAGTSRAARESGFVVDSAGEVACDPEVMGCGALGPARELRVVRVSEECGYWGEMFVTTRRAVLVRVPQSVGLNGGPGWALDVVEGADPSSYVPLGRGFGRDARSIFDRLTRVPGLDPDSFRVLSCEGGCNGCDRTRCLVDCMGHPLSRPRFCWSPPPASAVR